jgi:hypothetical protein
MKTFKNIATLACSAVVAFGLMACHSNEAGNGNGGTSTVTKTDIPVKTTNTLVVNLSRALAAGETLTYNGVTGVVSNNGGTTIVFENASDGGTLKLSSSDGSLIPQSTRIYFGDRNVVAIDLDVLTEKPGVTIPEVPADQETGDKLDGAEASISMKAGAIANNSKLKNQKFSITLFTPAVSPLTEIKKGAGEAALLAAKCNPVDLEFNPAVSFEATLPGAENCNIYCENAASYQFPASAATPTKLIADLTKFYAVHEIPMKYNITSIVDSKIVIAEGEVPAGTNAVTYDENYGFESNATGIIPRLFRQLFGTSTKGTASKKIEIKVDGNSSYVLYQKVKNIVIESGSAKFNVKIYGEVTADVMTLLPYNPTDPGELTPTEPEIIPTHNGGSND